MSRTTQYIGLTSKARNYVSKLKSLYNINEFSNYKLNSSCYGFFEDEVPLGIWRHSEKGIVREVVQEIPWSSGPMIFTRLSWDPGNEITQDEKGQEIPVQSDMPMFEWIHNPEIGDKEADYEKGEMWV